MKSFLLLSERDILPTYLHLYRQEVFDEMRKSAKECFWECLSFGGRNKGVRNRGRGDRKCVMVTMSLVGKECRRDRVCDEGGESGRKFSWLWESVIRI